MRLYACMWPGCMRSVPDTGFSGTPRRGISGCLHPVSPGYSDDSLGTSEIEADQEAPSSLSRGACSRSSTWCPHQAASATIIRQKVTGSMPMMYCGRWRLGRPAAGRAGKPFDSLSSPAPLLDQAIPRNCSGISDCLWNYYLPIS